VLQAVVRRVGYALGWRTEPYRVFSHRAVASALRANGFRIVGMHRQFVLPIAFHKQLNSAVLTGRIEGALSRVGLARFFGSPVTVAAERCAS